MPRPHPPEFRRRAVELARLREKPTGQIAADLGISDSCLRNWIRQADIDDGRRAGVTKDEHAELIELRRELRVAKMEVEILKRAAAFFAKENVLPLRSSHRWDSRLGEVGLPVATCCRVMKVSTSGFYAWKACPVSDRDWDDAILTNTIVDIHRMSRRSYGSPRVHSELRLGLGTFCSRKRVERLMHQAGIEGIYRRRGHGCTRRDGTAPSDDLVGRQFDPDAPNQLWVMDVTEHPTDEGKVYLAAVLDAWSRRVVGWSIADHIRSELVVDAIQMAVWRRQPAEGQTIAHSDHGSQYTSWAFGRRLRAAGLLGSMGSIGDCFDNAVAESFFGSLQLELLDEHHWSTRDQLANAIFDWIECWYNPRRRHSYVGMLSPIDYETTNASIEPIAA